MAGRPGIVRKNLRLDQAKLDRAREILGAPTETETVEQALDTIIFQHEVSEGIRRIAGKDPEFEHIFGNDQGV
jgi:hypothetical protein